MSPSSSSVVSNKKTILFFKDTAVDPLRRKERGSTIYSGIENFGARA
jgi:hypothetical protein